MDTSAYLTRQGWRGAGHALDPTGRGLTRPLLASRKTNHFGVGKKKHDLADPWWSRAFDASLQGVHISTAVAPPAPPPQTPATVVDPSRLPGRPRGLYSFFQKGEALHGTMDVKEITTGPAPDHDDHDDHRNVPEKRRRPKTKRNRLESLQEAGSSNRPIQETVVVVVDDDDDLEEPRLDRKRAKSRKGTKTKTIEMTSASKPVRSPIEENGNVFRSHLPFTAPPSRHKIEEPEVLATITGDDEATSKKHQKTKPTKKRKKKKKKRDAIT